jgi:hypothetical protein
MCASGRVVMPPDGSQVAHGLVKTAIIAGLA